MHHIPFLCTSSGVFYLINCYLSALYTVKCVGVFKIPYIPHFLSNYLTLPGCTKCTVHFSAILYKKMHEKGNHLCSSLLKIGFHHHLPFLIPNRKIWSHCLEVLVSSVCSNQFFIPTFFRTMHNKSSAGCVC